MGRGGAEAATRTASVKCRCRKRPAPARAAAARRQRRAASAGHQRRARAVLAAGAGNERQRAPRPWHAGDDRRTTPPRRTCRRGPRARRIRTVVNSRAFACAADHSHCRPKLWRRTRRVLGAAHTSTTCFTGPTREPTKSECKGAAETQDIISVHDGPLSSLAAFRSAAFDTRVAHDAPISGASGARDGYDALLTPH